MEILRALLNKLPAARIINDRTLKVQLGQCGIQTSYLFICVEIAEITLIGLSHGPNSAGLAGKFEYCVTYGAVRNLGCLTAHLYSNLLQSILSTLYQLYHLPTYLGVAGRMATLG